MNPIRIIFYGTSDFAVPILERLAADARFSLVAVVTQPDRPVGRHAVLTASPIKQTALRLNVPVLQFEKVKSDEAFEALKMITADVAVVASFGQIIRERVIDLTPHGMVNVHGSILPKYRGASPIVAAIRAGETETGVTIMRMDALMDHGPTLAFATEPIRSDDTTESLSERLSALGANVLPNVLFGYVEGTLKPTEQDHTTATSVKLLKREDGQIDWTKPADEIERTIRAYVPWPGTFTMIEGKRLKILQGSIGSPSNLPPGTQTIDGKKPAFVCGDGRMLRVERLQPEGKAAMTGQDFLRGQRA